MSLIYYLIFSSLLFFSFFEFSSNSRGNIFLYYSIVAVMILTAGLSYAISPDWLAYFKTFQLLYSVDWSELGHFSDMGGMEEGFLALNKLLGELGFDFGMVTLLLTTVGLILKSSTFYKFGGLPFLVLFIYAMPNFMFEEHVHIRQGFANSIAIFSVRYIIDRNLLKFLLCMVIGYQMHESIVVFFLAYWIATFKFNELTIGWLVALAIVGNYTGLNSIIEWVMQFMPIGKDKFEDYQSQLYTESGVVVGDIVKILSVFTVLIYDKYANHDKLYCMFRNIFLFGVLLYFFLGKGIFGIRLPGYYLVFLGLTLGRMLYKFNDDEKENFFKRKFIYFSFVSYTILLIFWFQYKQGFRSGFGNYQTFFTEGAAYGLWKN